jgi:uncharacterized membrane-anchored protein
LSCFLMNYLSTSLLMHGVLLLLESSLLFLCIFFFLFSHVKKYISFNAGTTL